METIIIEYISNNNQKFQRYNSWNHCFEAFGTLKDTKLLSLHLGFYLASWGMYREVQANYWKEIIWYT